MEEGAAGLVRRSARREGGLVCRSPKPETGLVRRSAKREGGSRTKTGCHEDTPSRRAAPGDHARCRRFTTAIAWAWRRVASIVSLWEPRCQLAESISATIGLYDCQNACMNKLKVWVDLPKRSMNHLTGIPDREAPA